MYWILSRTHLMHSCWCGIFNVQNIINLLSGHESSALCETFSWRDEWNEALFMLCSGVGCSCELWRTSWRMTKSEQLLWEPCYCKCQWKCFWPWLMKSCTSTVDCTSCVSGGKGSWTINMQVFTLFCVDGTFQWHSTYSLYISFLTYNLASFSRYLLNSGLIWLHDFTETFSTISNMAEYLHGRLTRTKEVSPTQLSLSDSNFSFRQESAVQAVKEELDLMKSQGVCELSSFRLSLCSVENIYRLWQSLCCPVLN